MEDAEALFLVDHDQAEILENHVPRDEPMRPDDDIDPAVAELLEDFALLGVRAEPAQHFDSHRVIEHPLPKRLKVLLREDRGGSENRDLFSLHHRFEGRANRHFGFAETDVAADQPIHRTRLFHVALGIGDGFELVGRFAKRKRMLKFNLPLGVGAKSVAALRLALGLEREHFAGVIED